MTQDVYMANKSAYEFNEQIHPFLITVCTPLFNYLPIKKLSGYHFKSDLVKIYQEYKNSSQFMK